MEVICVGKINRDYIGGKYYVGGSATNAALALKKFGLAVGLIGKVGNDSVGKEVVDEIKGRDVDISQVGYADSVTGYHTITPSENNSGKKMGGELGANALFKPADISEEYIRKSKIIHVGSIAFEIAKQAAKLAAKSKKILSIDPGYMLSCVDFELMKPVLKKCKFFFPIESELQMLTKTDDLNEAIKKILSTGLENLILKKKDSVEFISKKERFEVMIPKAEIVEPTGIGDSFAAGFLYGYIKGKSYKEAVELGINTAEKAASTFGGCYY